MTNKTPTEEDHSVIFREINLSAEVRRMWGVKWSSPEIAYEFGDRKFYLRTEDAGIYSGAASGTDGELLTEDGDVMITEDSQELITERSGP